MLGVDACKRGWIAIAVEDGVTGAYFAEDIQTLTNRAQADGPLDVVAVDMPIGLPDRGQRHADVLARAAIGPLRSSVFMTPVREALMAADHAAASAINREITGQGISIQAFGLKPKLFQVERWVRHMPIRRYRQVLPIPLAWLQHEKWSFCPQRRYARVSTQGLCGTAHPGDCIQQVALPVASSPDRTASSPARELWLACLRRRRDRPR